MKKPPRPYIWKGSITHRILGLLSMTEGLRLEELAKEMQMEQAKGCLSGVLSWMKNKGFIIRAGYNTGWTLTVSGMQMRDRT